MYQGDDGRYSLIEIRTGKEQIPEAEKMLLRFRNAIRKHNERAFPNSEPRRPVFQEPAALIDRCAKAPMGYTTAKGVKIVPVGCLRD